MIGRVVLFTGLLCASATALAQGQALHDAACIQCHSSLTNGQPNSLYTRADRKVKNLAGLDKRVKSCAVAADANWTDEQRNLVVNYLAKTFYLFN